MDCYMSLKFKILTIGLVIAASFSAGRFLTSPEIQIKEVEKIVYRESTEQKHNQSTVTKSKETKLPDGTVITEQVSRTKEASETKSETEMDKTKETLKVTENRPDWHLNVSNLYGSDSQSYTIDIQRRIIGEVYLGINVSTSKQVGFSIGIGF
jgi:SRSO17 transposase